MPAVHNIFIEKSHTSSSTLELSDRGRRTWIAGGDTVKWHIRAKSRAARIRIEKKDDSPEIFSTVPHPQGALWTGVIKPVPEECTEWEYSIFWKADGSDDELEYDPKISVMPSKRFAPKKLLIALFSVFAGLFSFFLGLFSVQLLRRNKNRK